MSQSLSRVQVLPQGRSRGMSLARILVLLYVAGQPIVPKLLLGSIPLHPFELAFLGLAVVRLARNRAILRPAMPVGFLVLLYALYLVGILIGLVNTEARVLTLEPIFLIIKYLIPLLMFVTDPADLPSPAAVMKFLAISLGVITFVPLVNAVLSFGLADLLYSYGYLNRAIGFTGYGIGPGGLVLIGTTSVQMGALYAFVILYVFSFAKQTSRRKLLFGGLFLMVGLFLTYSRTGFFILAIGLFVLFFRRPSFYIHLVVFLILLVVALIIITGPGLVRVLLNATVLGRIFGEVGLADGSTNLRVIMINEALSLMSENPLIFLFGSGYGEAFTQALAPWPHFESFMVTSLFQSGILSIAVVFGFFAALWWWLHRRRAWFYSPWKASGREALVVFSIGWLFSLSFSGNLLQTDFIAPLIIYWIVQLTRPEYHDYIRRAI